MTRILILDIPAPCEFLTANGRRHWRAKAPLVAKWREAGRLSVPEDCRPFMGRVRVLAMVSKPRAGRWDPANWHDTAKAALDGIVSTGRVLVDDDWEHVVGPDMRRGIPGPDRLLIRIEEEK